MSDFMTDPNNEPKWFDEFRRKAFGRPAVEWETETLGRFMPEPEKQPCLMKAFLEEERKKPANMRSESCLISCPCPQCNPATMKVGQ